MALTKFLTDIAHITALSNKPNSIDGLTGQELREKFDQGPGEMKTWLNNNHLPELDNIISNIYEGWNTAAGTFTYSSSDSPTFIMSTSQDCTSFISVGMKIRLVQSGSTKYFFVTAITSSTITLYGGTDYTLTNVAITNVYYSSQQIPYGWIESKFSPVILYINNEGGSAGTITLSETAAHFSRITIYYVNNDGFYGNVEIDNPNNKSATLFSLTTTIGASAVFIKTRTVTISGTSISTKDSTRYSETELVNNVSPVVTNTNNIFITKVVGTR